jgi:sigma-B regulation protein RsbU (phosphoserine phosphatase)
LLRYCNAGHHPPYLFETQASEAVQILSKTGMALGAVKDTSWSQSTVCLEPGNRLILYTDGITDAQDEQGNFFGRQRLLSILQTEATVPRPHKHAVLHIQKTLLGEIRQFMGSAPQHDDMSLMILARDP